jgi:hypothetical protein
MQHIVKLCIRFNTGWVQVLSHGTRKQQSILRQSRHLPTERIESELVQIIAVDFDTTGCKLDNPEKRLCQRAFTSTSTYDEGWWSVVQDPFHIYYYPLDLTTDDTNLKHDDFRMIS